MLITSDKQYKPREKYATDVEIEVGTTKLKDKSWVLCSQPYPIPKKLFEQEGVWCAGSLSVEKMDEIDNLDVQIEEKKRMIESLNKEIEVKEKKSQNVGNRMQQILTSYEQKALSLQMELLSNISDLKNEIGIDSVQTEEENRLRKGLKK